MAQAVLTINSRNYGAWSLRGWLLCRFAGLDFVVEVVDSHDPGVAGRAAPALAVVPGAAAETTAIWWCGTPWPSAEYLHELHPRAAPLPRRPERPGPVPLGVRRDALRLRQPALGAAHEHQGRITPGSRCGPGPRPTSTASRPSGTSAWPRRGARSCSARPRPWPTPCTPRCAPAFVTYDVEAGRVGCSAYVETMLAMPEMVEWIAAAEAEPDDVEELEMEF